VIWGSFSRAVLVPGPSLRDFWSNRAAHLTGIVLLPFLCYLLATPDRPWEPLTTYPFWALLSGVTVFSMGSSFWGRLYVIGLILVVLAFVMTIHLEWAVLELGVVMSVIVTSVALHLRRVSSERRQDGSLAG